jgi:heptosyltransferase-3
MRILVLRGGALGDFLVTLPALALLRQRWPDARIELIGNRLAASLAVTVGVLDAVHAQHEARWSALYGPAALPPALAGWLAEFDLVLNYWPDPDQELARRFPARAGQNFLSATPLPTLAPAAAHYCAPLRSLGLIPDRLVHPLRTPAPEPRLVALHPGSGSVRKNWPVNHWLALARWLQDELRFTVLVITGEAEPAATLAGVGLHLHARPLAEVADHLARCQLFVGHDSGISHLAAATGTPSVLLFGPTAPDLWAPPAPGVHVLQRGTDLAALSFTEVQQAVALRLTDQS